MAYAGIVKSEKISLDVSPVNKAYKRELIALNGLMFDETLRIAEDISFNVPYLSICKNIVSINEALYFYRCNRLSAIHVDKGFAEKGMERSVYFLSRIQKTLEKRISIEKIYPVAKVRYNRLVLDACSNQHKRKGSFVQIYSFISNCCKWQSQYLTYYGVELFTIRVDGKKAKLENFMVKHRCIILLYFYTKIMYLYHNR